MGYRIGNGAADQLQLDIYGEAMNSINVLDSGAVGEWGVGYEGWNEGWNDDLGAFVQYEGGDVLDASLVFIPVMGSIVPNDPRWQSTMSAMDKTLVDDSLVYRYDPKASPDGLPGRKARSPCAPSSMSMRSPPRDGSPRLG